MPRRQPPAELQRSQPIGAPGAARTEGFGEAGPWLRAWPLLLLVLPLLLIGPSLAPGRCFLPFAPVQFEPLRSEHPAAAAAASSGSNQWTADRLFPVLTDQLGLERARAARQSGAWDPHLGLGLPRLGNAIHGPDYPPNWLLRWLSGERAAAYLALFALFWPALGLALFLRARGLGLAAALIGALCLEAAGFGPRNLHYGMKVDAVAWLPWSLYTIERWAAGRRWALPLLGLASGMPFLAGFPPIAAFAFVAGAVYLLFRLLSLGGRRLLLGLLAFALGPLLAAPQLLPTLAASSASLRQMKTAQLLELEALPPASALSLLLPDLFGSPLAEPEQFGPAAAWWFTRAKDADQAQLAQGLEWDANAGSLALLLALVGLLASPRRALWPWALALIALGFAQAWPGIRWLYHLPVLAGGAPPRALAVAWIAWAWAAAVGAEALLRLRPRARIAALGLGSLALVLGVWLTLHPPETSALMHRTAERHGRSLAEAEQVLPPAAQARGLAQLKRGGQALALGGLTLLLAQLLASARRGPSASTAGTASNSASNSPGTPASGALSRSASTSSSSATKTTNLATSSATSSGTNSTWPLAMLPLGLGLLAELLAFTAEHARPRDLGGLPIWPASADLAALRETLAGGRLVRIASDRSPAQAAILLARPNLPEAYGVSDLSAYVAFPPASLVETFAALDPGSRFRTGFAGLTSVALLDAALLDAAQVRGVLSTTPLVHPRLEPISERPGWCLYRRTCSLPAVRFVGQEHLHADRAALLSALVDGTWDPARSVHRLGSATALRELPAGNPAPKVERPAPEQFLIELGGGPGGLLVLAEQFDRGWSATLDGQAATVFEADGCCLGVEVPAGARALELHYATPGRGLGWALAGAAAAALLLITGLARKLVAAPAGPSAPRPGPEQPRGPAEPALAPEA